MPSAPLDPDLLRVAEAWHRLPAAIRAAVLALVRTAISAEPPTLPSGLDDSLPPGFEIHPRS